MKEELKNKLKIFEEKENEYKKVIKDLKYKLSQFDDISRTTRNHFNESGNISDRVFNLFIKII